MRASSLHDHSHAGERTMFTNLLESKPKAQRSIGGTLVSMAAHVGVIVLAIQATLHAGQKPEQRDTPVQYTEVNRTRRRRRKFSRLRSRRLRKDFRRSPRR